MVSTTPPELRSLYRPLACQITNCGLISNLVHVIRVNLLGQPLSTNFFWLQESFGEKTLKLLQKGSDVLLVAAEVLWNASAQVPRRSREALLWSPCARKVLELDWAMPAASEERGDSEAERGQMLLIET